eukprot:TRINITY_DN1421_c0_g1_i1.p1 TRINITY_DN1421_c0_g1~~TRINITY_DN1421_c0_g1_i1.p1  ORF type:complete len:437 (+),score=80.70 TRINITY_DN1421_c0_g1_i1:133-1443(+)
MSVHPSDLVKVARPKVLDLFSADGANDIVVVRDENKKMECAPFQVRFRRKERLFHNSEPVFIKVRGKPVKFLKMAISSSFKEAYFQRTDVPEEIKEQQTAIKKQKEEIFGLLKQADEIEKNISDLQLQDEDEESLEKYYVDFDQEGKDPERNEISKLKAELQTVQKKIHALKDDETFRTLFAPTQEELEQMNLQPGSNEISFTLGEGKGIDTLEARIFLWSSDVKVVVSDIDGTITKSDLIGLVYEKHLQEDVAKLYSEIRTRHYALLYLSARPVGFSGRTRKFVKQLQQARRADTEIGDEPNETKHYKLPEGPIILSPGNFYRSWREAAKFKKSSLHDIKKLFKGREDVYFAAFGNAVTDEEAYSHLKIPKIYMINPKGSITSLQSNEPEMINIKGYGAIAELSTFNRWFPQLAEPREVPPKTEVATADASKGLV